MAHLYYPWQVDLSLPPTESSQPNSIFAISIFAMRPLTLDCVENTENMTKTVAKEVAFIMQMMGEREKEEGKKHKMRL